ncbi:MAG: NAD(P)/FAD-dependent oxidoreductase [Deltaproteobacteria bacterium]|nr:NAD(P)/FAD-dependent oxidoreductase [Deltaproteobacteria bacterium]
MIAGGVNPQLCKGTSHRLAHHLHRMAVSYGGDILEAREVVRVLVEDGVARGVQLADGAQVLARRFVASSLDPQTTFLQLVGPEHLDAGFARRVSGYEYSAVSPILSVNLSLREPPRYRAAEREPAVARSFMIIAGLECSADLDDLYDACRAGELPRRLFMNGACPTIHDPTQAPPGSHTAFMWPLVPYDLKDGGPTRWDAIKEAVMGCYLERWRQYAPNLTPANILHAFTNSPLDIERHVPNMRGGDWMVGALNTQQMYDRRPLPELARHRTPIDRLYLCGSCCHPGGNITGAPGYNAAGIIAADLGMDPWWHPHDIEALWGELR